MTGRDGHGIAERTEPWIIPARVPAGPGKCVWVKGDTYEKLRRIKERTGQSYAAIIEMLVERAK